MSFKDVEYLAKSLHIPDFKVLDLSVYCKLAKTYSEPKNCVIYIPHENSPNTGHYVGVFTEPDNNSTIQYQDSFGSKNEFPKQLIDTGRKFKKNTVKYQSWTSNNCGYLSVLFVCTHDMIDPKVKRF